MGPRELLRTVYLGDRGCKGVYIQSWDEQVAIHIDCVSRIRDKEGRWNCYTAEDIYDGRLVFLGVKAISLSPPGPIPNDYIVSFTIDRSSEDELSLFTLQVGSVASDRSTKLVVISILARSFHLEDPAKPGVIIDF